MLKKLFLTVSASLMIIFSQAQFSTVLIDSITDGIRFIDNNYLVLPDGYSEPIRAYKIVEKSDGQGVTFPAISSSDTILSNGWPNWITGAFDCFDYVLPNAIIRQPGDTLKIQFDLLFDVVSGSGENGRLNVALVDGVPIDGIQLDNAPVNLQQWRNQYEDSEISNMYNPYGTADMFGDPAYHFWIFSGNYGPALSYGGAYDVYPGWNSGAGMYYYNMNYGDHQNLDLYPLTDNYPIVPYSKRFEGGPFASTAKWKTYTWIIAEEMMHLYWRDADQGPEANEEIIFMAIPRSETNITFINQVHGTEATTMPPAYEWFERMNTLRFYYHSNNVNRNFYLSNIVFTKTGKPVATFVEFQQLPASRRRVRANAETYDIPVILENAIDGDPTSATLRLKDGNNAHVNGFTEETIYFPDNTGGEMTIFPFELTLTDLYLNENDTLIFELLNTTGGYYPTLGQNRTFELIIRPSGDTPSIIPGENQANIFHVYPNPASSVIYVKGITHGGDVTFEIVDMRGKAVLSGNLSDTDEIDLSSVQTGLYFIRFLRNKDVITRKFIRQK